MCVSKPKVPKPTPVVERQAYKSAPSRDSLSSGTDPSLRQRMIAGVATSARGVLEPASTTNRSQFGGDQVLAPLLSGGGAGGGFGAPAPSGAVPSGGGASIAAGVAARQRKGPHPFKLAA